VAKRPPATYGFKKTRLKNGKRCKVIAGKDIFLGVLKTAQFPGLGAVQFNYWPVL